mgnify:CR=1 FL=1
MEDVDFDNLSDEEMDKMQEIMTDMNRKKMDDFNPCYIPRNHIIERGLELASEGDMSEINEIEELLRDPCCEKNTSKKYLFPALDDDLPYITYCGT